MQIGKIFTGTGRVMLAGLVFSLPCLAQNVSVDVRKRLATIPKDCESLVPATIDADRIDLTALVKEAICKGSGDMLTDYSYVLDMSRREKDKKGKISEQTTTYEVFIPVLKSGLSANGVLLMTRVNGVPVTPATLERYRLRAANELEKEEAKIAVAPEPLEIPAEVPGIHPLGMYTSLTVKRASSWDRSGTVVLSVEEFLKSCDLSFLKRDQKDGRENLVFSFVPRRNAKLDDEQKYIAKLAGTIWIDAADRIVTRLAGWPIVPGEIPEPDPRERPPAVYVEMMRLREGVWFPRVIQINGKDYPKLFDRIRDESTCTYSNYVRFSTEIKDFNVTTPKP